MAVQRIKTPTGELYDIPIVGGIASNIGRIIDIAAVPCLPNAEIWVYAVFHASPTLLISLLKPEWVDLSVRHRRRKNRTGRGVKLKAADLFRDAIVEVPVPRWAVFQLYEWTQRIGWYFLVADATTEFVANFTSLAYQWNGCQVPNPPPYATSEITPTTSFITPDPGWQTVNTSAITEGHLVQGNPGPGFVQILEHCIPRFQLEADVYPNPTTPAARITAWRIMSDQSATPLAQAGVEPSGTSGSTVDIGSFPIGQFPVNSRFWVEAYKTAGLMGVNSYRWTLRSARSLAHEGFGPDP